jgi:tetratricopeptide (TPR) repeat protein
MHINFRAFQISTMKSYLPFLVFLIFFASCKNDVKEIPVTSFEDEMEMKKWDRIYDNFQKYELHLYNEYNDKPKYVISKIDSLLIEYKNDANITADLHYFKGEIFYYLGDYEKSIHELKFENTRNTEIGLICNYVKLKKFEKAKQILDSNSRNDINFDDFIYANYYEVIGKVDQARKLYENIKSDKPLKRFFYYQLVIERIAVLKENEPQLLNSIYFPTGNPGFKENVINGI